MKKEQSDAPPRMSLKAKSVIGLSCVNLVLLSLVNYVLYFISETWWVGTVLTYSPKILFLIPTFLLLTASLLWQRSSLGINFVSAGIVLVPIMGLSIPLDLWLNGSPVTDGETVLKVVSCNVQSFEPDFKKVLAEIEFFKPDVVALQEAFGENELVEEEVFHGWNTVRQGQYRVFSRRRVSLISECEVTEFGGRLAGMIVQLETDHGPVVLGNIHQMTARYGLEELDHETVINGKGTKELENYVAERHADSKAIRAAVDLAHHTGPLIVCGDFNTPTSSILFRQHWGDLKSSFDAAGFGYGYTSPCQGNRFWPENIPWARIDHILCSHEWSVRQCQIGKSNGSDHRLIAATLVLKAEMSH